MTVHPHPSCLLAEDQALIAMALEAYLDDVGLAVVGPFRSSVGALAWAEHASPSVALLDFQLDDGPCIELALTLLRRGVPVVIYSGHPRWSASLPTDLDEVEWMEKPVDRDRLLQVLTSLADPRRGRGSHPPRLS
ncbi:MAG TPA: response regulator [Salinarimonas sp.]|nr:response regulator [Salinarimonas sp.]